MAAKFFTGLPLDGPDPECVLGHGEKLLAARGDAAPPKPSLDHSKRHPSRLEAGPMSETLPVIQSMPDRACNENPLAGRTTTAGGTS